MPPIPIISAKEFIKFLEFKGFVLVRQKGLIKDLNIQMEKVLLYLITEKLILKEAY